MRSIAASTPVFSSSTMRTSTTLAMRSTRSTGVTGSIDATGMRTAASISSWRKALSFCQASARPAHEFMKAWTIRARPFLPLKGCRRAEAVIARKHAFILRCSPSHRLARVYAGTVTLP
jgi:hypothetical protein